MKKESNRMRICNRCETRNLPKLSKCQSCGSRFKGFWSLRFVTKLRNLLSL